MQFLFSFVYTWIGYIFCALAAWKRNVSKAYSNFGVYQHSKIISFIWWSGYVIMLNLYRSGFHLYESLVTKPQWKEEDLSFEFRSYYCMVAIPNLYALSVELWMRFNHLIPDFLVIIFGRLLGDYNMGVCVTTPWTTNIKSTFISQSDLNEPALVQAIKDADIKATNIKKINLLWITGNDEIEEEYEQSSNQETIFYIHGGAYLFGGASHIGFVSHLSIQTKRRVAYIMYDTPTRNPHKCFKTQIDQILFTWLYLVYSLQIPPNKIVMAGDSAGGGLLVLFMSMLSNFISAKSDSSRYWKFPRGIVLFSPWIDVSCKSGSWKRNQDYDVIARYKYAQRISKMLETPFTASVLSEPITVLCPLLLFVSKHENLYDDSLNLVKKLKRDNMENKLDLVLVEKDHMMHAWPFMFTSFPEAREAIDLVVKHVNKWFGENKEKIPVNRHLSEQFSSSSFGSQANHVYGDADAESDNGQLENDPPINYQYSDSSTHNAL